MYVRYLHKLCNMHLECDNFTEAACTLMLYAKLLNVSTGWVIQGTILKRTPVTKCVIHNEYNCYY